MSNKVRIMKETYQDMKTTTFLTTKNVYLIQKLPFLFNISQ